MAVSSIYYHTYIFSNINVNIFSTIDNIINIQSIAFFIGINFTYNSVINNGIIASIGSIFNICIVGKGCNIAIVVDKDANDGIIAHFADKINGANVAKIDNTFK